MTGTPWATLPLCLLGSVAAAEVCDPSWTETFGAFPGADRVVYAFETFDDGTGPALYAAGDFTEIAGVQAGCARFDGESWAAIGDFPAGVFDLEVYDDGTGPALYAAGPFVSVNGQAINHVAKWDGSSWSDVGGGISDWVFALEVFDDGSGPALYAGGCFLWAGSTPVSHFAKWDGANWSSVGGGVDKTVRALRTYDDGTGEALYAGGSFSWVEGTLNARRIVKWDGASFSKLDSGMNTHVLALEVYDDGSGPVLVAGGDFSNAGGTVVAKIAAWDGSSWDAMGGGATLADRVTELYSATEPGLGPVLYVGGSFPTMGNTTVNSIARWDGTGYSSLGGGVKPVSSLFNAVSLVWAVHQFDDGTGPRLFVGGAFGVDAGPIKAQSIATWDSAGWGAVADGLDGAIKALTTWDDGAGTALYAAGLFQSAAGVSLNRIGRWDGAIWSPLGAGTDLAARVLTTFDDGGGSALYAGGSFATADSLPLPFLAKWDGASWSGLGTGVDDEVNDLEVFDDGTGPALYAGGEFLQAGGSPANRVARWDGTVWSSLGSGLDAEVVELAVFDDGGGPALWVYGVFASAGGVPANRIAKWDGTTWSAIDTAFNPAGASIITMRSVDLGNGPLLCVGLGSNAQAATWDGSQWTLLNGQVNGSFHAFAVLEDGLGKTLYAGGDFGFFGGSGSQNVARLDGTAWAPLDLGAKDRVDALAIFDAGDGAGPTLYVGSAACEAVGSYLSVWADTCDPPVVYCTAKASSAGCVAAITTSAPTAQPTSGAADYAVLATGVQAFKTGLLFAGINGSATIPYSGGVLCVAPPQKRGPFVNSGGSGPNTCTGTFSTTVNTGAVMPAGLDAGAGNSIWYQYWYRDPQGGAGTLGTALSDAVRLDYD